MLYPCDIPCIQENPLLNVWGTFRATFRKESSSLRTDTIHDRKTRKLNYKSAQRRTTSRTAQLMAWVVVDRAINFNERAALRLNLISIAVITR